MKYLKVLIVISIVSLGKVFAQSDELSPIPDIGSYSILVLNSEIGENLYFFTQGRIHHYDLYSNQQQFLVRSAVEYKFSKLFKLHIGFANVDIQPFDKTNTGDFQIHRWFYDEFQFNFGSADKIKFQTRFRHERRWITKNDEVDTFQNDRLRLRMMFVKNLGDKLYARLFSEAFYSVENKKISKFRNNLSLGTKLNKELKFEVGVIDEGKPKNSTTFLVTRLFISTSWRNKEKKEEENKQQKLTTEVVPDKPLPKELLLNDNQKLTNIIDDHYVSEQTEGVEEQASEAITYKEVQVHKDVDHFYVIVAAHKDKSSISASMDRLTRDGYSKGNVLEVAENGYYRVYADEFTTIEEAQKLREQLMQLGYRKPWIYTETIPTTVTEQRAVEQHQQANDQLKESEAKEGNDELFDIDSNLKNSDLIKIQQEDTQLLQRIEAQRQSGQRKFKSPIYHLVIGAVTDLGHAPKHLDELKTKGYKRAYVFKKPFKGLYRISAAKSKNIEQLKAMIPKLEEDGYPYSWIFDTTIIDFEDDLGAVEVEAIESDTIKDDVNPLDEQLTEKESVQSSDDASLFEHHLIVLSSKDLEQADSKVKQLKAVGYYNAVVLPVTYKDYYRVSAAYFETETEAKVAEASLIEQGFDSAWIFKTEPLGPYELSREEQEQLEEAELYERSSSSIEYKPVYHVVAASSKDQTTAEAILEQLRSKGFINAYILEEQSNGNYRISAAHFKNKYDAQPSVDLLKQLGHEGAWILKIE